MKFILEGLPASLRRYSIVKYEMQTASTRASLGLSTGSPFTSLLCIQGKVLRHMPRVEISTNPMESREIILAQNEDWGFSNKSHRALETVMIIKALFFNPSGAQKVKMSVCRKLALFQLLGFLSSFSRRSRKYFVLLRV